MPKIDIRILLLFLGRLFQSAFAVVTIKVMTVLLPQAEIGNQYLIQSLLLGFVLVFINPVGMFVNRHFHEWKTAGRLIPAIKELNYYFGAVAIFTFPVVGIVRFYSSFGVGLETVTIACFILCYIYISTWFQTLVSFFNLMERHKIFVVLNVLAQSVGLLLAFIFIKLFGAAAVPWLSGLLAGQAISLLAAVVAFRKFVRAGKSAIASERLVFSKVTFWFCLPLAMATLFMWFINQGYRLIVETDIGVNALALLGLGLGLTTSFSGAIESIATQYFYPAYYASLANSSLEQRRVAWEKLWANLVRVYIPTFFLTLASSYFLVRFLTSEKFFQAYHFIFFGAAIELLRQMSNIAYLVPHGEKKTKYTVIPYLAAGVALIALILTMRALKDVEPLHVAGMLILANSVCLAAMMVSARKLIGFRVNKALLLKCIVVAAPVFAPWFFVNIDTSLGALFVAEALAGVLWAGAIYILFKARAA